MEASAGYHQGPGFFHTTELTGVLLQPKQYPQRTGRLIT